MPNFTESDELETYSTVPLCQNIHVSESGMRKLHSRDYLLIRIY